MPKRREGPRRDKKTGFYYFDEYMGLGQDKERVRFSLKTKDPDKVRWRWEQEYRKHWSKYYGIESPVTTSRVSFVELVKEFRLMWKPSPLKPWLPWTFFVFVF